MVSTNVSFNNSSRDPSVSIDVDALEPAGASGAAANEPNGSAGRRAVKIATVSHTLNAEMAERLRHFAFRERISESAVIEFALGAFFLRGTDTELGKILRDAGAALRRKI